MRFDIAYGATAPLLTAIGLRKSAAYVELDDSALAVRMGWSFSARVPLDAIDGVKALDRKYLSIGVHGWNGNWLVNGQQDQLVRIHIDPAAKISARVGPAPVKLTQLTVSLDEPDAFVTAVTEAIS